MSISARLKRVENAVNTRYRAEVLADYAAQGIQFDFEEELAECLPMTEEQFERRCRSIERYKREPSQDQPMTREESNAIVAIATTERLSFAAARERYNASRASRNSPPPRGAA